MRGRAEKVGLSVSGATALCFPRETIPTTALTSLNGGKGEILRNFRWLEKGTRFVTQVGGVSLLICVIICCLFQNITSYRVAFALLITTDALLRPLTK